MNTTILKRFPLLLLSLLALTFAEGCNDQNKPVSQKPANNSAPGAPNAPNANNQLNRQGAPGAPGIQGAAGAQGPAGVPGTPGKPGAPGAPGAAPAIPTQATLAAAPPPPESLPEYRAVPMLTISIHGDGKKDPTPDMQITAAPLPKADRASEQPHSGRYISTPIQFNNQDGQTTVGHLEFRHPTVGLIEPFHVEKEADTKIASYYSDNSPVKKYDGFDLTIDVPIDGTTYELFANVMEQVDQADKAYQNKLSDKDVKNKDQNENRWVELKDRAGYELGKFRDIVLHPAFKAFADGMSDKPDAAERIRKYDSNFILDFAANPKNIHALSIQYAKAKTDAADMTKKMQQLAGSKPMMAPPPPQADPSGAAIAQTWPLAVDPRGPVQDFNTPNRIRLAFVAEGFTASEQEKFHQAAQDKWNYLFGGGPHNLAGVSPFREYRNYFVGVALGAISPESGACHHEDAKLPCPNTAFGAFFGNFNIPRLLGISPQGNQALSNALRARAPGDDLAALLVNSTDYGGAGGQYAMVSLDDSANEVIAHELMGHTFAKLGDEYDDAYPGFPEIEEPNTSKEADPAKWALFASSKPPSSNEGPNSVYTLKAGAHYHGTDDPGYQGTADPQHEVWYRPSIDCKMRELGQPFCDVCKDGILRAIYNKVKPIDTATPAPGKVNLSSKTPWSIAITPMQPDSKMSIQWSVDNKPVANANAAVFDGKFQAALADGKSHILTVTVQDTTDTIKQTGLASQTLQWQVKLK